MRVVAQLSNFSGRLSLASPRGLHQGRGPRHRSCPHQTPGAHLFERAAQPPRTLDQAILKVEGMNLEVLPVRGRPSNPSELLSSPRMRELVEEVARRYDRVILDTPAALGVPDAKAVAELCDGVVLVVRADVTSQQDAEATLELLDRSRLLGVVLNGAHVDRGRYGYTS